MKKALHSVSLDPKKKVRSEFLIPQKEGGLFIGLTTGKRHERGMVCFAGRNVGLDQIKEKLVSAKLDESGVPDDNILERFIDEIRSYRVGNILKCCDDFKMSIVSKKLESPPADPKPLP